MALPESNNAFMEGLYQQMKQRAKSMAPMLSTDEDARKLNADDVSMLWNRRSMPVEKEWELFRARNPDGTPMFTREQIGLMVFPDREGLAKRGGRIEPKDQISFVNQTAQREAMKRQAQMPPSDPTHDMLTAMPDMMGGTDDAGH